MMIRQVEDGVGDDGLDLAGFRRVVRSRLTMRGDALFEVMDAVVCSPSPVTDLARLSLVDVAARGHGSVYDAVNAGRVDVEGLRGDVAGVPIPRFPDGRIVVAVDVSNWLRPDAGTSPDRLFCHVYARGRGQAQMIPGWPYSWVVTLEPGRASWTCPLDVRRIGPDDDETLVTATQVRQVVENLVRAGRHTPANPDVMVVMDSGYDAARLAWLVRDVPVLLVGRVRSDWVYRLPPPDSTPGPGRPARHGPRLVVADETTWPAPSHHGEYESPR